MFSPPLPLQLIMYPKLLHCSDSCLHFKQPRQYYNMVLHADIEDINTYLMTIDEKYFFVDFEFQMCKID